MEAFLQTIQPFLPTLSFAITIQNYMQKTLWCFHLELEGKALILIVK